MILVFVFFVLLYSVVCFVVSGFMCTPRQSNLYPIVRVLSPENDGLVADVTKLFHESERNFHCTLYPFHTFFKTEILTIPPGLIIIFLRKLLRNTQAPLHQKRSSMALYCSFARKAFSKTSLYFRFFCVHWVALYADHQIIIH